MGIGKQIRLQRLFSHPSGRLCSVAVDHFIGYGEGIPPGLWHLRATLEAIVAGRPDAVTMHRGIAASAWEPHAGRLPLILQSTIARPDDTVCQQIAEPEDAVRMGAEAFAVAAFVRGATEGQHLKVVAECVRAAARYDMPVITHIYPRDVPQGWRDLLRPGGYCLGRTLRVGVWLGCHQGPVLQRNRSLRRDRSQLHGSRGGSGRSAVRHAGGSTPDVPAGGCQRRKGHYRGPQCVEPRTDRGCHPSDQGGCSRRQGASSSHAGCRTDLLKEPRTHRPRPWSWKLRVAEFARIRGVAEGGVQPATARILGNSATSARNAQLRRPWSPARSGDAYLGGDTPGAAVILERKTIGTGAIPFARVTHRVRGAWLPGRTSGTSCPDAIG